ncbi:MAG: cell division protein ZapA [Rhodothermales bacterium]
MAHTIRVHILGRDYALRVDRDEDAGLMQEIAEYVDARMQSFQRAHPERPELTSAVIAALAIAEDLFTERSRRGDAQLLSELDRLASELDDALAEEQV